MNYNIITTKKFDKDLKSLKKSSPSDAKEVLKIVNKLAAGENLNSNNRPHKLKGNYGECMECHVKPDLLLIYTFINKSLVLKLIRVGSHSKLFKK